MSPFKITVRAPIAKIRDIAVEIAEPAKKTFVRYLLVRFHISEAVNQVAIN